MLPPANQKRKSIRLPVDLEVSIRKDNKEYTGRILNLSPDGILAQSLHLFDSGDQIDISFYLPGSPQAVNATAKVMWGGPMETTSSRRFAMGIQFEVIAPDQLKAIAEYIQTLLRS